MKTKNLFRFDSWKNLLTGFGSRKDKSTHNSEDFGVVFNHLADAQLAGLYYSGGCIKNAVKLPAESMVQNGFEVQGDDGSLYLAFQSLDGPEQFEKALLWTRLYGGAIIVLDVKGAGSWEEPWYPEKGNTSIRSLRVYPRTRVDLVGMEINKQIESPYFEDFEYFVLRKVDGTTFRVHASRCLLFKSTTKVDPMEPGWLNYERYWGLSAIYEGFEEATNLDLTGKGVAHAIQEFSVGKYTLSNLEQLVAESDYKSIENRLEAMDLQKSVINGVFLGQDEDYKRENITFTGVPEIWDRQMMNVSGAFRVPVTRLFGRSAAGMNSTGEGDETNYNDYISGLQKSQLLPPLRKLMTLLNFETKAVKDENGNLGKIIIDFNPLSRKDQKREAEIREIMSRADKNYVDSGILPPDEVIRNRFLGGFAIDTSVDDDRVPDLSEEE